MTIESAAVPRPRIPDRIRTALGLAPSGPHYAFYRHKGLVRAAHWINALCLVILFMSGLNIFNAHTALYWGENSVFDHPLMVLGTTYNEDGMVTGGVTGIFGHRFDTTGIFGASMEDGNLTGRGFPPWITLPTANYLAMARQWHFAFAWLLVFNALVFFIYGIWSKHFARDLAPTRKDLAHLPREIIDHARLKFPHGEKARHYNALQKLAYCFMIFIVGPLIVLTGLTMSPTMDSAFPILLDIFGGRQSARTIHFICAFSFFGFFIVHILMVILSGTWNNLRSMITGWYVIRGRKPS